MSARCLTEYLVCSTSTQHEQGGWVHSFNKFVLSAYYVPGIILEIADVADVWHTKAQNKSLSDEANSLICWQDNNRRRAEKTK